MTIAYPLKSQSDYSELRYSLRSIERFYRGNEVVIIGSKLPDWIDNVTWIRVEDIPNRKQLTIKYKILAALEYTDEIYLMNDDVFLLEPPTFKYYYHGDLASVGESGARPLLKQLQSFGKTTKNFDGHYNLVYRKDFKNVMEHFAHDVIVKSAYCNYLGIEGELIPDNKIISKKTDVKAFMQDRNSISTGVSSWGIVQPVIAEIFKGKSMYEK